MNTKSKENELWAQFDAEFQALIPSGAALLETFNWWVYRLQRKDSLIEKQEEYITFLENNHDVEYNPKFSVESRALSKEIAKLKESSD